MDSFSGTDQCPQPKGYSEQLCFYKLFIFPVCSLFVTSLSFGVSVTLTTFLVTLSIFSWTLALCLAPAPRESVQEASCVREHILRMLDAECILLETSK